MGRLLTFNLVVLILANNISCYIIYTSSKGTEFRCLKATKIDIKTNKNEITVTKICGVYTAIIYSNEYLLF